MRLTYRSQFRVDTIGGYFSDGELADLDAGGTVERHFVRDEGAVTTRYRRLAVV